MKKTKVLIPALGILLLSTAATVSGSLAWFTANRSVTVQANDFAIVNMNGALKCNVLAGKGTVLATGKNTAWSGDEVIEPAKNAAENGQITLTDASYDYASNKVFTDIDADVRVADGPLYKEITDTNYADANNADVHYAFTWQVEFVYMFDADHTPMDLFFDSQSSAVATQTVAGDTTKNLFTYKGFRIAMVPAASGDKTKVWLPFRARPADTNTDLRVVTDKTTTAYTATDSIYGQGATCESEILTKATDLVAANTSRLDYLATIDYSSTNAGGVTIGTKAANSEKVVYNFVAWYEGTDEHVVNDAELDSISSTLKFYVRQHKNA